MRAELDGRAPGVMTQAGVGSNPTVRAKDNNMEKLYIVVRRDLPAGAQASQCCHALRQFSDKHPELDRQWHAAGGNIVLLSIESELELAALIGKASEHNVSWADFHEADFGGELTAAAFAASARRLVSSLPLALREFSRAA